MIRLILIVIFLILYFILLLPVLLVLRIMDRFRPIPTAKCAKAIVGWGFRCISHLAGTRLIAKGVENIPTDTPVLYVGNHRSYFDIVLSLSLFPGITGYVAKIEMIKIPFLRIWMKTIHCLFLDRDNIKEGLKTILTGIEEVKRGHSICIFPEGTRNRTADDFLPFHEGSLKIAEKGGIPIVPMTIVNSAAVFEDHLPKIKKATVVIEFGNPITVKELSRDEKKELSNLVQNTIKENYYRIQNEYFKEQ